MTPEELRVAINAYLDKGPDFIKFGGTAHFARPAFIGFSPEAQRVMVEEAHKRGKKAETHATTPDGLRLSVAAGIDLIQHPEVLGPRELPEPLVRTIVERRIVNSMLVNTITGAAWAKHLKDSEAAKTKAAEEAAKGPARARTAAELRRDAADLGAEMEMRRRNAQTLIRRRRRRHRRHRQLLGLGAGAGARAQGGDAGPRHRHHPGHRGAGRAGHDADAGAGRGNGATARSPPAATTWARSRQADRRPAGAERRPARRHPEHPHAARVMAERPRRRSHAAARAARAVARRRRPSNRRAGRAARRSGGADRHQRVQLGRDPPASPGGHRSRPRVVWRRSRSCPQPVTATRNSAGAVIAARRRRAVSSRRGRACRDRAAPRAGGTCRPRPAPSRRRRRCARRAPERAAASARLSAPSRLSSTTSTRRGRRQRRPAGAGLGRDAARAAGSVTVKRLPCGPARRSPRRPGRRAVRPGP